MNQKSNFYRFYNNGNFLRFTFLCLLTPFLQLSALDEKSVLLPMNDSQDIAKSNFDISLVSPFPQTMAKYSLNLNYRAWENFSLGFNLIRDINKYRDDGAYHNDYIFYKSFANQGTSLTLPFDSETIYDQTKFNGSIFGRYYFSKEKSHTWYSTFHLGRSSGWNVTENTNLVFISEMTKKDKGSFQPMPLSMNYNIRPYYYSSFGVGVQIFFEKLFTGLFVIFEFGVTYNLNGKEKVTAYNDPSRYYYPNLTVAELFFFQTIAQRSDGYYQNYNIFIVPLIGYSYAF